jgi:preprotein translocase subunit SecB
MNAPTNGGPAAGTPGQPQPQPQLQVLGQYIKDLSFENPNAPRSLQPAQQPNMNIQINVDVNQAAPNDFEVSLRVEGKAEAAGMLLFSIELVYAGMFRLTNFPQEAMHPAIMIECPRLLFPFAREVVASTVRNGGFPPLVLEPVDFVSLYRQKVADVQAQQTAGTG